MRTSVPTQAVKCVSDEKPPKTIDEWDIIPDHASIGQFGDSCKTLLLGRVMESQEQALTYFSSHATDWLKKSTSAGYSVVGDRHDVVLRHVDGAQRHLRILDIGCGTGQLAVECALRGHDALGVDFAPEMIEAARIWNDQQSAGAQFLCSSIFDLSLSPNSFDIVSGQGLIEYMSLAEIDSLLDAIRALLVCDGSLVLGSRNRLFNVLSFNDFSMREIELGTMDSLVMESALIAGARNQDDLVETLLSLSTPDARIEEHPNTGIEVTTRWQFTPAELAQRLAERGFATESVHGVNFHAVPVGCESLPGAKSAANTFRRVASEEWNHDHRLIPYSSSFVIVARKRNVGEKR